MTAGIVVETAGDIEKLRVVVKDKGQPQTAGIGMATGGWGIKNVGAAGGDRDD